MLCPKCGYNSFEHNTTCPNCKRDLMPTKRQLFLTEPPPGNINFFAILSYGAGASGDNSFNVNQSPHEGFESMPLKDIGDTDTIDAVIEPLNADSMNAPGYPPQQPGPGGAYPPPGIPQGGAYPPPGIPQGGAYPPQQGYPPPPPGVPQQNPAAFYPPSMENAPLNQQAPFGPPQGAPGFQPPQGAPGFQPPQGVPGFQPPQGTPGFQPPQGVPQGSPGFPPPPLPPQMTAPPQQMAPPPPPPPPLPPEITPPLGPPPAPPTRSAPPEDFIPVMGVADTGQMDVSQLLEETEEIKVEPVSTNIAAPPLPTPQEPEPDTIFDVEVMEEPQEVLQVTEAQDDQDFGNFFEPQKANGSTQAPQSLTLNKVQQDVSETFMVPQDSLETSEDSLGGDFSLDEEDGLAVDSTDMADLSDMLDDLDDE